MLMEEMVGMEEMEGTGRMVVQVEMVVMRPKPLMELMELMEGMEEMAEMGVMEAMVEMPAT